MDLANSIDLHDLLKRFVKLYDSGIKQRDSQWYNMMGVTVGGSEIAAIMGVNKYSTFFDIVESKLTVLSGNTSWTGGGAACWWGILFEDIICQFVSVDLGSEVLGDEICIQEIVGHRNSPDGYIVAKSYYGIDNNLHIWTTDMDPIESALERIFLLEFKCPISRKPTNKVPAQYIHQVWSGLAVSPVASLGLFVDATFRKCGISDIGNTEEYDTNYHIYDHNEFGLPFAWGMIGVYAPSFDAPRHIRLGWKTEKWAVGDPNPKITDMDSDAAQSAYQIYTICQKQQMQSLHLVSNSLLDNSENDNSENDNSENDNSENDNSEKADKIKNIVDFGNMETKLFNRALKLMDKKRFLVSRLPACFADGRGSKLHTENDIEITIKKLQCDAPSNHWLLGVIPWKLFEVNYLPVNRNPNFTEEVLPIIDKVHKTVQDALMTGDPFTYLNNAKKEAYQGTSQKGNKNEDMIQDLFDFIS